jgi:hypothetical protein
MAFERMVIAMSLSDSAKVRERQVPETFVMDLGRWSGILQKVRRLAITSALFTLVLSLLQRLGAPVPDEDDLMERIDCDFEGSTKDEAVGRIAVYVLSHADVSGSTVEAGLRSCYDPKIGGLREVRTRRVVQGLMADADAYVETPRKPATRRPAIEALGHERTRTGLDERMDEARREVQHLFWYSSQIYGGLWNGIICNAQYGASSEN